MMCRALMYLGTQEISLYDLLYGSDNSLVRQSYAPQLMSHIQNLAGFGFCAWSKESHHAHLPYFYKTTDLPFYDANLFCLSNKIISNCVLAHIRGVEYSTNAVISSQNAHPFKLDSTQLAFAHNGSLARMTEMKHLLKDRIKPNIFSQIHGTTDSEWVYSLFLSQLQDHTADISLDEAWHALLMTLTLLRTMRKKAGINEASPLNLFITNGKYIIVVRFVYDFGCNMGSVSQAFFEYHSLWVTFGEKYADYDGTYKMHAGNKRKNILFASEPLTMDRRTWIELPEYSITKAWIENGEVIYRTHDLVL